MACLTNPKRERGRVELDSLIEYGTLHRNLDINNAAKNVSAPNHSTHKPQPGYDPLIALPKVNMVAFGNHYPTSGWTVS
jgi:hypothetical protein